MTNKPIDFESFAEKRLYEQGRERLRPYYGNKVNAFDWGQIDDLIGRLDDFIERYGEPLEPAEFLKYDAEQSAEEYEKARELLRSWGLDQQ